MRVYILLGGLFIVLVVVGGVIVVRDGIYRSALENISQNGNFELLDEVSLDEENSEFTDSNLTASVIGSIKKESSKEKVSEDTSENVSPLPENPKKELPSPGSQEIIDSGQVIPEESGTVPQEIQEPPRPGPELLPPTPVFPVDINTAGFEELQNITGIGPVIARRIIDDRVARGPFYYTHDIRRVNGIGDATFEKMRYQITVGNVVPPPPPPPPPPPQPAPPPAENNNKGNSVEPTEAKVNINTASQAELEEITGVGPVIAGRIIDYLTENGPFGSIEEIKNVSGIGDVTFEKMKDEITI